MAKTDKERIQELNEQCKDDIQWRNNWAFYDKWEKWEQYYRGIFAGDNNEGIIPVNIYFPTITGTIPQVYYKNPGVFLQSRSPGGEAKAKVATSVLNIIIDQIDLKKELRRSSQDTFICGTGFLTHGYDSEYGIQMNDETEEIEGTQIVDGKRIEYDTGVQRGAPWTKRDHPEDVLLPWGCTSEKDIRRVTFRRLRLKKDLEDDPKYRNVKDIECDALKGWGADNEALELNEDWVIFYERHDLRDGKVKAWAAGHDKFLRKEDSVLLDTLGEAPITPIVWNYTPRSLWGVPDAKQLEEHQKNINDVNTKITKRIRQDLMRFFYDESLLDGDRLEKMTNEESGTGIPVDGSPRDAIMPMEFQNNPMFWNELNGIKRMARETVGIPQTSMGSYTPKTKRVTGKEVRAAEMGGDIRLAPKREAIADAIVDCARKYMKLITKFWDDWKFIRVPKLNAPVDWVGFRGQDLAGNYGFQVNPEDMAMPTAQQRQNEAAQLGPMLIEASQLKGVNGREAVRQALEKFPGWDADRIVPKQGGAGRNRQVVGLLTPKGKIKMVKGVENERQGQRRNRSTQRNLQRGQGRTR